MSAIAQHPHRVAQVVADARTGMTSVADASLWTMGPEETAATLTEVAPAKAQLAELEARLLIHAETVDVGAQHAMSTANWHAVATRSNRTTSHRALRFAHALQARHLTRTALAEGRITLDHATVIVQAVGDLPERLDPELVAKAEAHLLDLARDYDAKALKNLGRHLVEVIDPDGADAHTAKLLEREERAAQAAARLTVWDDGHGQTHGRFTIPTAITGAALKKALLAIAAPRHQASKGPLGPAYPGAARRGVLRAHRALPRQEAAEGRRPQRDRRRDDPARHPDGWAQSREARHR